MALRAGLLSVIHSSNIAYWFAVISLGLTYSYVYLARSNFIMAFAWPGLGKKLRYIPYCVILFYKHMLAMKIM